MCGIAGIWGDRGPDAEGTTRVELMLDAMRHRGPDGRGALAFPGGAAGMVRLALVDLSERGQQPLYSQDRRVAILFNGEIYNFREERCQLEAEGYRFSTTTDTEVALALYLEHGRDFVRRLRGMFSIALLDFRETAEGEPPTLLLARDPFGIKPLYLAETPRGVAFCSELRPLVAAGVVPATLDERGAWTFLTRGYSMGPGTLVRGVTQLEPGTLQVFSKGRRETTRFYELPAYAPRHESLAEAGERLRAVLRESVRLQALADAPVGAFLSGGIDSTGITALMAEQTPHLKTYTVRFTGDADADESPLARAVAERLGCEHHVVEVADGELANDYRAFASGIDQPSVDGFNTWLVARRAAVDVKGVLSGIGGDEWFAGYPSAGRMAAVGAAAGRAKSLLARLCRGGSGVLRGTAAGARAEDLAAYESAVTLWLHTHRLLPAWSASRLLGRPLGAGPEVFLQRLSAVFPQWKSESPLGLALLLDSRFYMGEQLLRDADATSMAHSLELRVPFVDPEVVAFSRTCADHHKLAVTGNRRQSYRAGGAKAVLIEALRPWLPPDIADRPKRGFSLPYERWLTGPLRPLVEEVVSPECVGARGVFEPRAVAQALAQARATGRRYPVELGFVVFELWARSVLDLRPPPGLGLAR